MPKTSDNKPLAKSVETKLRKLRERLARKEAEDKLAQHAQAGYRLPDPGPNHLPKQPD